MIRILNTPEFRTALSLRPAWDSIWRFAIHHHTIRFLPHLGAQYLSARFFSALDQQYPLRGTLEACNSTHDTLRGLHKGAEKGTH